MKRYSGDPYWLTVRFDGRCSCGQLVKRGEQAFYYPRGKTLCGKSCGCADKAAADFAACAQDETFYSGGVY